MFSYSFFSITDYQVDIFSICSIFGLIFIGLVYTFFNATIVQTKKNSKANFKHKNLTIVTLNVIKSMYVLLVVACFFYCFLDLHGRYFFYKAVNAKNEKEMNSNLIKASKIDSKNIYYLNVHASLLLSKFRSKNNVDKAIKLLKKSLKIHPYQDYPSDTLARVYLFSNSNLSIEYAQKALLYNPRFSNAYGSVFRIYKIKNNTKLASHCIAVWCFMNPSVLCYPELVDYFYSNSEAKKTLFEFYSRAREITTYKEEKNGCYMKKHC